MAQEKANGIKIDNKKLRANILLALNEMVYKNNVVSYHDKQKVTNQIYKKYDKEC